MNTIFRSTFFLVLLSISFIANSGDMNPMKEMMKEQFMASCDDTAFLSCIGINRKKCLSSVEKTMASCDNLFPNDMSAMNDTTMNAHGDCITKNLVKHSGVSQSKVDACDTMAGSGSASGEPLMSQEQAMAMMTQGLQAHAAATGTDGVTLPLYKNGTVLSHFAHGEMTPMFKDVEQLPALVMSSPDKANKIVSYYRKKLKGFKEYKIEGGTLFMEKGPKDFSLAKHMKAYVSTPHVAIFEENGGQTGSKIEIAYKKK